MKTWNSLLVEEKELMLSQIKESGYSESYYHSAEDMAHNIRVDYENEPEWFSFEVGDLDKFESQLADMLADDFRKLYALIVTTWNANDYLNDRNTDPIRSEGWLFASKDDAIDFAKTLQTGSDIYNEAILYTGGLDVGTILEITRYDSIEDFDEALAEPYCAEPNATNYGAWQKGDVAVIVMQRADEEETIECANYDFGKSLDGAILVFWSWEKYVGYARKCIDIRRAGQSDTAAMLTKQDKTFATQCDVLLTAEEVAEADDLQESVREALSESSWKWTNPRYAEQLAIDL